MSEHTVQAIDKGELAKKFLFVADKILDTAYASSNIVNPCESYVAAAELATAALQLEQADREAARAASPPPPGGKLI